MGHYAAMPRGRWVLASFIPVGWLTWVGLGYAGFRAERPQWVWLGLGYALIAAAAILVTSLDDNEIGLAARRIVAAREGVGGFSSLEDLGMTMDLPGDVVEELRGRAVFLPR